MPDDERAGVTMIRHVAARLGPLLERVVFLGGAVTGLLLTDTAAPEARFTEDVDVVVAVDSRAGYYRLEETLRDLAFTHVREVICRWNIAGVLVDVMPTDATILGFSNRWYPGVLETATRVPLGDSLAVRLVTAPYFVATKLEAFSDPKWEGSGDYFASRDMADVIAVLDGRPELTSEIAATGDDVRLFLSEEVRRLLADADFREALSGHLMPDDASQRREPQLLQRLEAIAELM